MSEIINPDLQIVYLAPEELTPYEKNTRRHTQTDIEQIKTSTAAIVSCCLDTMKIMAEYSRQKTKRERHGTGGQTMQNETREQLIDRIEMTKKAIQFAGPVHRRDLRKHLKRMLAQVAQYDRFQAAAQREVG